MPTQRNLLAIGTTADRKSNMGPNSQKGFLIPQQRKLMGSSDQIRSGVCRCGSQEQVPEEGSGRLRRVPACAGVGSGGGFRKVPKRWFRKVLEGSGGFRRVLVSGACWRRFRRQGSEGFRRVPVWFVALQA